MYQSRGNHHQVTIVGSTFWVDSNQEEALILWLEANGFHGLWRRPLDGMQVGKNRYTPDVEVSVLLPNGKSTRAIIESKPTLKHFTADQNSRMRKTAKFYFAETLLLYTHADRTWRQVDMKTGALTIVPPPAPGKIPINKLYKPFSRKGQGAWNHTYRRRLEIGRISIVFALNVIEQSLVKSINGFLSPKRGNRRRKRK